MPDVSMMPRHQTSDGFTLIEVLISISLFALAMTLLMGGFRFTQKAWDAGERVSVRSSDLELAHRLLVNMTGRFLPLPLEEASEYAFHGDEKRVRFAAKLPPYPAAAGLHTLEFAIAENGDQTRLTLQMVPFDRETFLDDRLDAEPQLLWERSDIELSFGYAGEGEGAEWQSQWSETETPPRRLRLKLEQESRYWPEIVAPLRIDMDLACLPIDLAQICRLTKQ